MRSALHLTIATPMDLLVDEPSVRTLRAADESGAFGILPGHTDFLTALPASVVRWTGPDGDLHFCALRAGLMTVTNGTRIAIACREGVLGDDLAALEAEVEKLRAEDRDAARRAQVEQMRLHARAVRQLVRFLHPGRPGAFDHPPRIPVATQEGPP